MMISEDLRADGRAFAKWFMDTPELVAKMQPFSAHFGVRALDLDPEEGFARLEYDVPAQYCNFLGNIHGGMAAALMDDAAGMAAALLVGAGLKGTAGSSINYLAPAKLGKVVVEARIVKYNRSLLFAEMSLLSRDELCVRSSTTMLYGSLKPVDFDTPATQRVRTADRIGAA